MLLRHLIPCALALALPSVGKRSEAKIAIIAITTSNSINVNPVLSVYCSVIVFIGLLFSNKPGTAEFHRGPNSGDFRAAVQRHPSGLHAGSCPDYSKQTSGGRFRRMGRLAKAGPDHGWRKPACCHRAKRQYGAHLPDAH